VAESTMNLRKPLKTNWEYCDHISSVTSRSQFKQGEEVHVWNISTASADRNSYYNFLSVEEKAKASRFKLMEDRQRYIISHGALRILLCSYVQSSFESLVITKSKYGKPMMITTNGYTVQFNMSHSKDVTGFIFSVPSEVGIDIEFIEHQFNWRDIASEVFTSREFNYLISLPIESQVRGFYKIWTQKEALLKALGIGLFGITEVERLKWINELDNYTQDSYNWGADYQGSISAFCNFPSVRYYNFPVNNSAFRVM
jgi:4'-phosphopantetheinyl transferase